MQYIWTFFWTFLLVHMLTYVAGSMIGSSYDFMTASILGIAASILLFIVATVIPTEPVEKH